MSLRTRRQSRASILISRAIVETIEQRILLSGTGLTGQYFNTQTLTGYVFNKTDPQVSFSWGSASPGHSIASNSFSARWEGTIDPTTSGTYTFYTNGNGGEQLWVNGQEIINNWTSHTTQDTSATISLNAGTMYSIEQDYFSSTSSAATSLSWSDGGATTVVPETNLYPLTAGPGTYTPETPITTTGTPSTVGMPAGWSFEDIGGPTPAGSSSYDNSSQTWTVNGGGTLADAVNNEFQYADTQVTGDFSFVTQLTSESDANNGSLAGAMIRTALTASSSDYFIGQQPGSTRVFRESRVISGSEETSINAVGTTDSYLKLVRGGNSIDAYFSPDGVNWTFLDGQQFTNLPGTIYVGLAVASRTNTTLCAATFANTSINAASNNNLTAFVGNTFGGGHTHVPDSANGAYVDPATGQVLLNSTDEQDSLSIYNSDGSPYTEGTTSHFLQGNSVYADANFIFKSQDNQNLGTASGDVSGLQRFDRYASPIGAPIMGNDTITGITESGGYLYVGANNMVYQFDPSTLNFTGTMWEVDRGGNMATDHGGDIWVIQNAAGGTAAQVTKYTAAGVATGNTITFPASSYSGNTVVPAGIAYDNADGNVYVTDTGALQNIHYYNDSGGYLGDFGDAYGIYGTGGGTTAGADAPLKFDYPMGVGFDNAGDIYVVDGYPLNGKPGDVRIGTSIRKFTRAGNEFWADNSYEYVSVASADPSAPTNIYTDYWELNATYSNALPGDDATAVGTLIDPFAYPTDPRIVPAGIATYPTLPTESQRNAPIVRTIDGTKFLFDYDGHGSAINIYRFVTGTDYTVFCGEIVHGDDYGQADNAFYIWTDSNGDGVKQPSEETFSSSLASNTAYGEYVDSNGNVWILTDTGSGGTLYEFKVSSTLNSIGAPQYNNASYSTWTIPTTGTYALTITNAMRVEYIASSDTLVLGAYTTANPLPTQAGSQWGQAGSTLYAFTHWSTSGFNQAPAWSTVVPNDEFADPVKALDVAGNYVFASSFLGQTGIEVYSLSTGALITTLTPGAFVNSNDTDTDFLNSINATELTNGQYEIYNENDNEAFSALYQWTPASGTTPAVSIPNTGWTNEDIDNHPHNEAQGSTLYNPVNQSYTVIGSGEIWDGDTYDYPQFASTALNGDGQISAELTSTAYQNTGGARTGVMLRDTTTNEAQAPFAAISYIQGGTIQFQYRVTADTDSSYVQASATNISLPVWLKVVRSGNSFSGYYSTDGSTWTQVGTAETISMIPTIQAGLAVSSHSPLYLTTAVFTNVLVSPVLVSTNIGTTAMLGSSTWGNYKQTYTVTGGGAGVIGTSDNFNFANESTNDGGTGSIVTRLNSLSPTSNAAQAGIMYRNSTAAGDTYAALLQTSTGLSFQYRTSYGANNASATLTGITGPIWLKLTRSGNSFSAFYSPDGNVWTQIGTTQTVTMITNALAGVAVSSMNNGAPLATAVFGQLEVQ